MDLATIVALGISGLSALGALGAAVFSANSAKAAKRAITAQIRAKQMEFWYSDEQYDARMVLREWYDECHRDGVDFAEMFSEQREKKTCTGRKVDLARRHFTMHFRQLFDLLIAGYFQHRDVYQLVNWSDLRMLVQISIPLEVEVWNQVPDHKPATVATFTDRMCKYMRLLHEFSTNEKCLSESSADPEGKAMKTLVRAREKAVERFWKTGAEASKGDEPDDVVGPSPPTPPATAE